MAWDFERVAGPYKGRTGGLAWDGKAMLFSADPYNSTLPYGPAVYPPLDHASVLRLERNSAGDWFLTRVTRDTRGPRAVVLAADERTLYVADGDAERGDLCQLFAYPVQLDGSIGHAKLLLAFAPAERGIEGLCLDSDGNLIACAGWKRSGLGPMLYVISPSGTVLEAHPAPADLPMRCAFGDARLASLYVTAGDGAVYRARNTGRRGTARGR